MSTFMLKNSPIEFTPVSNIFIDKYMAEARGEFVKVYLLMLKYRTSGEVGVNSSIVASNLHLLESDVMNALDYWNTEGVIKLTPIDNMGNYDIDFCNLSNDTNNNESVDLLSELDNNNSKDMLKDIEKLISRPLSTKEMSTYLSWQKELNFSYELILLLIEYCVSKGKTDVRYIEKVALGWHNSGIQNIEDAQSYIAKHEDKWIQFRKILDFLGMKNAEIMKPQQDMMEKWLYTYNFSIEMIKKAATICFNRLNHSDFKYMDGILSKWHADNIKTIKDIELKDAVRKNNTIYNKSNTTAPNSKNNAGLKFNNFKQREYDYDELEKKLLGWDDND